MNAVDTLRQEYKEIELYLASNNQVSMLNDFNKSSRKVLLMSAASFFEHEVTGVLKEFVSAISNNDPRITNFLYKQAISGKYHQLFSWGKKDEIDKPEKKANAFWKLFGDEFKERIENDLKPDSKDNQTQANQKFEINKSIAAFLEIGHLRNILTHSNFAAYSYDQKTTDEIYLLFQEAEPFIAYLRSKLL